MEILIGLTILAAVLCCLGVNGFLGVLIFRSLRGGQMPAAAEERLTPEEQEARRLAAEAQKRYEQGFVNLMCYDGMPAKKREGML